MAFDPDETQEAPAIKVDVVRAYVAKDADDPINAGVDDDYSLPPPASLCTVTLHITVNEKGRVFLTAYDWGASMISPGKYVIETELQPA